MKHFTPMLHLKCASCVAFCDGCAPANAHCSHIQVADALVQYKRLYFTPTGQVMERWWFHKRRCLDIGCNEGLVTLAVAARFGAASMLGVDLDEHLIRNACRHAPALSNGTRVGRDVSR